MYFARFYGFMSLAFAALMALFYFAGAFTDAGSVAVGFIVALSLGIYLLAYFPARLSEEVAAGRGQPHS